MSPDAADYEGGAEDGEEGGDGGEGGEGDEGDVGARGKRWEFDCLTTYKRCRKNCIVYYSKNDEILTHQFWNGRIRQLKGFGFSQFFLELQ